MLEDDAEAVLAMARRIRKADYLLDEEFVRMAYSPSDVLVALRPGLGGLTWSEPYQGQPYAPRHARVIPGGWNHDHCFLCGATVTRGMDWWAALPPDEVGVCPDCHDLLIRLRQDIQAGLRPDPRAAWPRPRPGSVAPMTEAEWLGSTIPRAMLMSLEDRAKTGQLNRKLRLFACACVRRAWHLVVHDRSRAAVEVAERYADGLATPEELDAAYDGSSSAASDLYVSGGLQAEDEARIEGRDEGEHPAGSVRAERPGHRAWKAAGAAHDVTRRKVGNRRTGKTTEGGAWVAALTASLSASDAIADAAELRRRIGAGDAADEAHDAPLASSDPFAGAEELRARDAACSAATDAHRMYQDPAQADLLRCLFGHPDRPIAIDPASASLARAIDEHRAFHRLPDLADSLERAGCRDPAVLAHCRDPGHHARGCWVIDAVLGKS